MNTNHPQQPDEPSPGSADSASEQESCGQFREGGMLFLHRKSWLLLMSALDAVEDDDTDGAKELGSLREKLRALFAGIDQSETLSALVEKPSLNYRALIFPQGAVWFREPLIHMAYKDYGLGVYLETPCLVICGEAAHVVRKEKGDALDLLGDYLIDVAAKIQRHGHKFDSLPKLLDKHVGKIAPSTASH
jgi:hypothetical protein